MGPAASDPPDFQAEPSDQRPSPASLSVPGATTRPPSVAGLRPALGQAPSTAPQRPPGHRSRPKPAPPPLGATALAITSGSARGRKGAVEAIIDFIPQPPGCRQGTSMAPVAAWQLLPSSKKCGSSGLRTFGSTTHPILRPRGRGDRNCMCAAENSVPRHTDSSRQRAASEASAALCLP